VKPTPPFSLPSVSPQSVVAKRTNCRANAPWAEIRSAVADRPDEEHGRDHEESRNGHVHPKGLKSVAHTPRSAADTEHLKAKTEMLQMRLAEKRKELVRQEDVNALIDDICGVMLTALSSMPAQVASIGDLATRRRFEKWVFETRTKIADTARQKADAYGEPPLDQPD
jgi:phage terminase Nu1 subunit (DNA packaging protein)